MIQQPKIPDIPLEYILLEEASHLISQYHGSLPMAYVHSFGCQQNASDTEKIKGILAAVGYGFTDDLKQADFVIYNTCAVRESAEDRVLGNVGYLKNIKRKKPNLIIALCGCMMQQQHMSEKIQNSYPYVDIVFGTGAIHLLAQFIIKRIRDDERVFYSNSESNIIEGVPVIREDSVKAWLPIMHGCDNYCSYCIVPYVRGRESSRADDDIEAEYKTLVSKGYKEITLLGQNVNSYGKTLKAPMTFTDLIKRLDNADGEYWARFMTSHPKDCSNLMLDAVAQSKHFCHHIHLPVQSGSDSVLSKMNRNYTVEKYLETIEYARSVMPNVTFSSDIIVGFPGETADDFEKTLKLIEKVRYNALFTFIYSPRKGTPAADMNDPIPPKEKSGWFRQLVLSQQNISHQLNSEKLGSIQKVLIDSQSKNEGFLMGRTAGNVIVELEGDKSLIGQFKQVKITKAMNWAMLGELA